MRGLSLSIVIPAYNEAALIERTVLGVLEYLRHGFARFEVIVSDDGSTDGTVGIVEALQSLHPEVRLITSPLNRGKGHAVRAGMLTATMELVLFADADMSTPITELGLLIQQMSVSGADVVIGSRAHPQSSIEIRQPWYREYMGRTFNIMLRVLMLTDMHDTQCGFKLFRLEAGRMIFGRMRVDRFSFDVEALYIAGRLGLKVAEVPVRWINHEDSRVRIVRDSMGMLVDLLLVRARALLGAYGRGEDGRP